MAVDVYEQHREYLLKKLRNVLNRLGNVDEIIEKRNRDSNPKIIPLSE